MKEGRIDGRKPDLRLHRERLFHAVRDARARGLEPDVGHRAAEQFAILRHVDGALRGPDHLDVVFLEHPLAHQIERGVERRLSAHGRQQRARTLLLDDALDGAPIDRLDIDRVGGLRIGHDGGRIGVHQDDAISLFFQCLTRLSSRIVELARLTDDDRSRADDEDAVEIGSLWPPYPSAAFCLIELRPREFVWMRLTIKYMKCSNSRRRSCGSGARLGVTLEAEGRPIRARDALQGAVEQRAVRRTQRLRQRRLVDREAMVLAGYEYPARIEFRHRVIGAVMAELHFDCLRTARKSEQLMPEANAEHRDVGFKKPRDRRDGVIARLRVTRAVT